MLFCGVLLSPRLGAAVGDYDPESEEWNGLSRLVSLGRAQGLTVEHPDEIDYASLTTKTSLLIVYPTVPLNDSAIGSYLERGGRVLIADDFGSAAPLLSRFGIERDESPVEGGLRFRERPSLPIAAPVMEDHVLTVGVRRLVSNHPASLLTKLPPVYTVGQPERTLVAIGSVEQVGRIVLLSDPSVLINNMLEMRGNARFARNLLGYLAGDERRELLLLSGRFVQRGGGDGGGVVRDASSARREANARLARLSGSLAPPPAVQPPPLALVIGCAVLGLALGVLVIFGLEPKPRLYSGRWLEPLTRETPAGFLGTLEYLKGPGATRLYPMMILKRELEEHLLESLGLDAPARLRQVMTAYKKVEPDRKKQKQLENLLVRLSAIAGTAASAESPLKVSGRELQRTVAQARELLKPLGRDILEP